MFFCSIAAVILVDATFMSSLPWLARVFVQVLLSLFLAAEGASLFYFSVVS